MPASQREIADKLGTARWQDCSGLLCLEAMALTPWVAYRKGGKAACHLLFLIVAYLLSVLLVYAFVMTER